MPSVPEQEARKLERGKQRLVNQTNNAFDAIQAKYENLAMIMNIPQEVLRMDCEEELEVECNKLNARLDRLRSWWRERYERWTIATESPAPVP